LTPGRQVGSVIKLVLVSYCLFPISSRKEKIGEINSTCLNVLIGRQSHEKFEQKKFSGKNEQFQFLFSDSITLF
jgi:hypothetical protein